LTNENMRYRRLFVLRCVAWRCGLFYPGCHPRECTDGTAAAFNQARADFEKAWCICQTAPRPIVKWRDDRDWTAEKYRRFDRHERMPPDWKPPQRRASG
jgi:hypothetical protein